MKLIHIRLVVIVVVMFFISGQTQAALALSPEQKKIYDSNIGYFDFEELAQSCGQASNLVGSDNAEKIWNFLTGKGLTPIQAAGIMGNLQAESGFNPKRVQSTKTPEGDEDNITVDGKTGYGIAQWTDRGRQQKLAEFASKAGKPSGDLDVQLDFLYFESNPGGNRPYAWPLQAQQTDVRQATYAWEDNYENPRARRQENRVRFAQDSLAKYGSGNSGASSDSTVCASGNGQIVQGYSLPVDRRIYDENPSYFSKPHHDYPAADIPLPTGTNVYSVSAGKVIAGGNGGSCGGGIVVDAGDGVLFIYCHGSDGESVAGAKVGDRVEAGQLIMHSANTGRSDGPHLHLAIKVDGQNRCPQNLLTGTANGSPPAVKQLPSSGCTYKSR